MSLELSRRHFLASGLLGAAGTEAMAGPSGGAHDPRLTAEGQVKLQATLDGSPAFWTYSGVIYAVVPDKRPLAILALAGCQSSWARARSDGAYGVAGAILTFFRDVRTGAFLESFDNPLTGRRNPVKANILSGGSILYPADGSSARAQGQIKAAVIAPRGFQASDPARPLGAVRWSLAGPSVLLMTDRAWNVAVQPQLEAQTQIGEAAAFFDPRVRRMPASFTATTIIPWMTWMDMGGAPGHLVWHSSGQKVFSVDDLPADYRAQAGDRLGILTTPPAA
jgi:hypothetical protein